MTKDELEKQLSMLLCNLFCGMNDYGIGNGDTCTITIKSNTVYFDWIKVHGDFDNPQNIHMVFQKKGWKRTV